MAKGLNTSLYPTCFEQVVRPYLDTAEDLQRAGTAR